MYELLKTEMEMKNMSISKGKKKIEHLRVKTVRESIGWYDNNIIRGPEDGTRIANHYLDGSDRENFIVLGLDTKNKVNFIETVSVGTVNGAMVHPREVFKSLITGNATSFIVAHNHPTGDCTASTQDIDITKRLQKAGELMGIDLLDSLIVTGDINNENYVSLKSEGHI